MCYLFLHLLMHAFMHGSFTGHASYMRIRGRTVRRPASARPLPPAPASPPSMRESSAFMEAILPTLPKRGALGDYHIPKSRSSSLGSRSSSSEKGSDGRRAARRAERREGAKPYAGREDRRSSHERPSSSTSMYICLQSFNYMFGLFIFYSYVLYFNRCWEWVFHSTQRYY